MASPRFSRSASKDGSGSGGESGRAGSGPTASGSAGAAFSDIAGAMANRFSGFTVSYTASGHSENENELVFLVCVSAKSIKIAEVSKYASRHRAVKGKKVHLSRAVFSVFYQEFDVKNWLLK